MKLVMELNGLILARREIAYGLLLDSDAIINYQKQKAAELYEDFAEEIGKDQPTFYVEGVPSKMNAATFEMNHQTQKAA